MNCVVLLIHAYIIEKHMVEDNILFTNPLVKKGKLTSVCNSYTLQYLDIPIHFLCMSKYLSSPQKCCIIHFNKLIKFLLL